MANKFFWQISFSNNITSIDDVIGDVPIYIYIYIYECHHQTGIGFHEANILKGASIQKVLKSRQALKYSKGWRHEIAGSPLPLRPSGTLRRKDKIFLFSTLRYINLISTVTCI